VAWKTAATLTVAVAATVMFKPDRMRSAHPRTLTIKDLMAGVLICALCLALIRGVLDFLDSWAVPWAMFSSISFCFAVAGAIRFFQSRIRKGTGKGNEPESLPE